MQMHVKLCLFLIIEMEYVIQDGKPHSEENIYFLNVVFFLFCQQYIAKILENSSNWTTIKLCLAQIYWTSI